MTERDLRELEGWLARRRLPPTLERRRLRMAPGASRPTSAEEWAGALVVIEHGRLEVACLAGGQEIFDAGDCLALGWLPLRELRNPGPREMRLVALRRRGPPPTDEFLGVVRSNGRTTGAAGSMMEHDMAPEGTHDGPARIDAYLATLPDDQRTALTDLRAAIRRAAPEAEEIISYGIPAVRDANGVLVGFNAAKAHLSLHVFSGDLLDGFRDELAGHRTTKGGVRFTPEAPLPEELVTRLVRAKAAENAARRGGSG